MRFTQLFGRTLRTEPGDAETPSHRLLLRAGMIAPLASGLNSYLPLGQRALRNIERVIHEEMGAAGGQELRMPALQPADLWEQSGRAEGFGQNLIHLKDRRQRDLVLAPTHEEVVTLLGRSVIRSYRDLPLLVYQIQTKFRDEPRPRGGLIRAREFDMKDAYSFHATEESLDQTYRRMAEAYRNIFSRCGLNAVMVEADSGAIGGKDSHEFILPTVVGEDTIVLCSRCGYAANTERAQGVPPPAAQEQPLPTEEVHTPNFKTIEEVSAFLKVPPSKTLKAVFYIADSRFVFVAVRGDLEVNEIKLLRALKAKEARIATPDEVERAGIVAGFASPVGLSGITVVADRSVAEAVNFVAGANRPDYHLRNVNYPRDFPVNAVADIALAQDGHGCPRCRAETGRWDAGHLQMKRGIEVGHIFKLGTAFSEKFEVFFLDKNGKQQPALMGCYGIGVGRLLAAAIEANHDERGMVLPASIAPYQVYLVGLNLDDASVSGRAEELYERLRSSGLSVLFDDRPESAGVKLNDADLLGFPVRVVVSPRTLKQGAGAAEVKARKAAQASVVPLEGVAESVKALLSSA
ncbi:MAG: proline--tRNA ligase [Dehalococcoidia bacterium]|nr:proline--tRNA ligase [Dehalococcoidia bacterium]